MKFTEEQKKIIEELKDNMEYETEEEMIIEGLSALQAITEAVEDDAEDKDEFEVAFDSYVETLIVSGPDDVATVLDDISHAIISTRPLIIKFGSEADWLKQFHHMNSILIELDHECDILTNEVRNHGTISYETLMASKDGSVPSVLVGDKEEKEATPPNPILNELAQASLNLSTLVNGMTDRDLYPALVLEMKTLSEATGTPIPEPIMEILSRGHDLEIEDLGNLSVALGDWLSSVINPKDKEGPNESERGDTEPEPSE